MRLEEILLGKEETIVYRGTEIIVFKLRGANGVYRGSYQGINGIFLRRWETKDESGETPAQRAKKIWPRDEMRFLFFPSGLISARRGRYFASLRAARKIVPRLEQILDLFETEAREKIIIKKFFSWDVLPLRFKEKILESGFIFSKARKPELKESFRQIICLVGGANGKINVGAFLTRTTAITDRLRERLAGIYGWLAVFSAQEQVLAIIEWQFQEVFKKLQHELRLWRRHSAFSGKTTEGQRILFEQKVRQAAKDLQPFSALNPFDRWASLMIGDIEHLAGFIKTNNLAAALASLERIELSLEIKSRQKDLDSLLQRLGEDEILGQWHGDVYGVKINSLIKFFKNLSEKEISAKFVEPISEKVFQHLSEAVFILPYKNFWKLREPLKKTYVLF